MAGAADPGECLSEACCGLSVPTNFASQSVSTCIKTGVDFLTVSLEILDNACIINMCTISYHQYRTKFLNDFS